MASVNVFLFGFGSEEETIRTRVTELLQKTNNAKDSVITRFLNTEVKCAQFPEKDEPFFHVYSDDEEGGEQVAKKLVEEFNVFAEFIRVKVFLPK